MAFVLTLHSIVRWLLVLAGLAAVILLAQGLSKKLPWQKNAQAALGVFAGLMDLQLTLGFIFYIWNGMMMDGGLLLRHRLEHLTVMVVAVLVAHLPAMWKKGEDNIRYRNSLIAVVISLLLVVLGVAMLPGNRWLGISGLF